MITEYDVVYISGPMTGYDDYNRPLFNRTAHIINSIYGCSIVNPAEILEDLTWTECMILNLENMREAGTTVLYQLPFWQNSKGAVIEHDVAVMSGLLIL